MAYVTSAQAAARAGRTVDSSSVPTSTTVGEWIAEIEADINGEISALGLTAPVTDATGIVFMRGKVAAAVAARILGTKMSQKDYEPADVEKLKELRREWDLFLRDIRENPMTVAQKLGQAPGETGARLLRAYQTDNDDSLSIDNGDFDAEISKKDTEW